MPVCWQWFDVRDLAQIADHIHDDSVIEVLERTKTGAARGSPALKTPRRESAGCKSEVFLAYS
jgi:hypothetical protein